MKKLSEPTTIPTAPSFQGSKNASSYDNPSSYRRNLPHLRSEGATYFVTFRQADSIPEQILKRWIDDRINWLRSYAIDPALQKRDPKAFAAAIERIAPEEHDKYERERSRQFFIEIDRCHGSCVLREAHHLVSDSLTYFHGKRVWIGDFVVMPNHVHVIVQPFPGVLLEEWLYSVKRFSSSAIGKMFPDRVQRDGHFWQTESFDRIIRDDAEMAKTREYIANNPRKLRDGEFCYHRAEWP